MKNSYLVVILSIFSLILLSGCQPSPVQTQVIATTFNVTTAMQQKLMEKNAPQDIQEQQDVRYHLNPNLHFDLYRAKQQPEQDRAATVVWIHGGGWISGSKQHAKGYFQRLADAGYNVVAIQYQFAPTYTYPTQLNQINDAMAYIQRYASHYDIDPEKLFFAGDSAGANLVSHYAALVTHPDLAQREHFKPAIQAQQIRGLILHCGIYDMQRFVGTANEQMKIVGWAVKNMANAYTAGRENDDAFLKQISPIQYIHPQYPPVLISSGNRDFLTETQAYPFVTALKPHSVPVTEVFYPESKAFLMHEYQFFMWMKEAQQTFDRTLEFLKQYHQP